MAPSIGAVALAVTALVAPSTGAVQGAGPDQISGPGRISGPDQAADTLRLVQVVDAVSTTNPTLQAARYRADAARHRVGPAGALPDPMLSFGLQNRPVDNLGRTDVEMTMNMVQLSQGIPWPGTLGFGRDRSDRLASADSLDARELESALLARAASAYYRIAYLDRAAAIMEETRDLLRDFRRVSEARYAVGEGIQQDVLQAQVAVARMSADLEVVRQDRVAMVARLNGLMGRPATTTVPAVDLPAPGPELASVDALMDTAAVHRPAFGAARLRAQAAEAAYRQAQRDAYPDLNVMLAYGQRPDYVDLLTLSVGVSLPVFSGSRQGPEKEERLALQRMEEAREMELHDETYARLAELRAQADRARTLSDLYRTSLLPQARASVEAALSAYQVGNVDYMTLLTSQMTVNQFEVERVRLAAEYHEAVAGIASLTGWNRSESP